MIEITIQGKTYHFRDEVMSLDTIHVGLPLIDTKKFEVKDPLTKDTKIVMEVTKMDPTDQEALNLWSFQLLNRMGTDKIDWTKQDPRLYQTIVNHHKITELREKYMLCMVPYGEDPMPVLEPIPEKKKLP
jgi:hypothetical protein